MEFEEKRQDPKAGIMEQNYLRVSRMHWRQVNKKGVYIKERLLNVLELRIRKNEVLPHSGRNLWVNRYVPQSESSA